MKTLIKINLGLILAIAMTTLLLNKLAETKAFLMGSLFGLINLFLLLILIKKIMNKSSLGPPLFMMILKYSFLGLGLFFIVKHTTISLPWMIFGLSIFIPSVIIFGFLIGKKGYVSTF